jgi:hypothetical protein
MLEKPNLPEAMIAEGLRERYGLADATIEFLPIG